MTIDKIKKSNFFKDTRFKKIHFVGIGGSGMSGIALIFIQLGYTISGSDLSKNITTKYLQNMGAKIYYQHSKKNIQDVNLVVKSSAIRCNNPELIIAKKKIFPYF